MAGLYIHIPFCKRKCSYCDFYSVANTATVNAYILSLCKELDLRFDELRGEPVTTIYIGGGTPSILSIENFTQLIGHIGSKIPLKKVEEFTVEVNPEGVSESYISALHNLGVNRISMGIQSFCDDELKLINRRHSANEAETAVGDIKRGGISNISIDLIYGIPGQTMQTWKGSVERAVELNVQHISAYNLSYEEGTKLFVMRALGKIQELPEDTCIDMYNLLVDHLEQAGYDHYEVSNFAQPGYYSRHNSSYWDKTIYLGLGASAHSFDGNLRSYNPANIKLFIDSIEKGELPCEREEENTLEQYNEDVMIRLRTKKGISTDYIERTYGLRLKNHFVRYAAQFITAGTLKNEGSTYCLTKEGVMLSDMIIRELMYVD